mgnify:FL=1|tara:strand:+ start:2765 stop:3109 length:345 start_codon:yes stop_codon:yes gene_type:complete
MITINFTGGINNDSLQIGDLAYFVTPSSSGGFEQSTATPALIGSIEVITATSIDVDETIGDDIPGPNDFIMFAKDSSINLSGLVGYYAEVKIKNNSTEKAEMFSIASEVTPSSK